MAMTEIKWIDIFGDNLLELMKETNMTQRELAKEARLSESTISRFISKQQMPSVRAIVNIAYALNCSVVDLVDFGDDID